MANILLLHRKTTLIETLNEIQLGWIYNGFSRTERICEVTRRVYIYIYMENHFKLLNNHILGKAYVAERQLFNDVNM